MISKLRYLVGIVLIVCLMPIVSQGQDDSRKDSAERAHRKAVVKKDWKKTKNAVNKTYHKAKHLPGSTYHKLKRKHQEHEKKEGETK
jgi:hypothetical protein